MSDAVAPHVTEFGDKKGWLRDSDSPLRNVAKLCDYLQDTEWKTEGKNRISVNGETVEVFDCRDCDEAVISDVFELDRKYFIAVVGDDLLDVRGLSLHAAFECCSKNGATTVSLDEFSPSDDVVAYLEQDE